MTSELIVRGNFISLQIKLKGITGTVNYAVYIYVKLQITVICFYFLSVSPINPNHIINLLREIHGNYACHPPTPNHRMYHPPSYNTHTLKGPPPPTSNTQGVAPTNLIHTLKGPPAPHPLPPTIGNSTHHLTTLIH